MKAKINLEVNLSKLKSLLSLIERHLSPMTSLMLFAYCPWMKL